ncbi:MAG TPA: efflux RND transporter periplasmic adaptor subunit [Myxococcota bacterium]|nr:efflux RND transporter periplasmic adaptor subunit [Myxococcota bacterium]HQK51157.1 efflux RND transporter periplasmic adaptor subunit [Myxococcota bacterium]
MRLGRTGWIGLAALAVVGCQESSGKVALPEQPTAGAVVVGTAAEVRPTDSGTSWMSGTLEPYRRSTLMAQVPGVVQKVLAAEGQRVRAGDPLVVIRDEDYQLRLRQAQAGLEAAEAQARNAELQYRRLQELRSQEAVPQSQLDVLEAGWKAAKAQIEVASANLALARKALRDTVITAPYDGIVVRRMISEGESATAMPPTPLVVVEKTDPLELKLQVPSSQADRVAVGTPLKIRLPASGQEMDAQVTRLVPSANPGSRAFLAVVEIPNPDGALRAGVYGEARLASPDGTGGTSR